MSHKLTRASLLEAMNNPEGTLERLFAKYNLAHEIAEVFNGAAPSMIFGGVEGAAPAGILTRSDEVVTIPGLRGLTADGQNINEIWNEMQALLAAFNASAEATVAMLTFRLTQANEKVGVPTNPGFQVATELGRPSKVRLTFVSRGFPLEHYDLADGYTQEFIDDSQAAQLLAVQATILTAWSELQKELTLDAIFGDTNYTDKDGVNVKRLYNGDGEVPPTIKRWSHDGTHTHYLTSAGANLVQADLDTMSDHLVHHGFREFGDAAFLLHAHRDDVATIRGFANFIPAESGERPQELANSGVLVGPRRGATGGLQVEGWVNDWTVIQDNDIPSGYLLGLVSGGPLDNRNVVGYREHDNPSARGLRLIEGPRQNYPLYDSVYDGYSGAGVAQRGAGVVMDIGTGAYVAPTFSTGE